MLSKSKLFMIFYSAFIKISLQYISIMISITIMPCSSLTVPRFSGKKSIWNAENAT